MKRKDKLLLFFGDHWDDMWRRRQQLAWRLAQTDLIEHVVYIERPLPITSFFKFLAGRADLDGMNRWRRVVRNRSWLIPMGEKLSVLTTFAPLPPVGSPPLFQASELIRDQWLSRRLRKYCDGERPMVWVSHPQISVGAIQALEPGMLWYDCTEDFSAWPGLPDCERRQIQSVDQWLSERGDVVTAVSRTLYEEKRQINSNTYWLPNAVDIEIFQQPRGGFPMPPDLRGRAHPILAFVGGLGEWAHDWRLLDQVATLRPEWSFLLIGGLRVCADTKRMLEGHPNIICTGQKSYKELPAYLVNSDVCFQFYIPSRKNNTRNSQKLFLYLAAGKPIVSTPSADVGVYTEFVNLVNSAHEFAQGVEKALSTNDDLLVKKRQAVARENSWTARVESILRIFQDVH